MNAQDETAPGERFGERSRPITHGVAAFMRDQEQTESETKKRAHKSAHPGVEVLWRDPYYTVKWVDEFGKDRFKSTKQGNLDEAERLAMIKWNQLASMRKEQASLDFGGTARTLITRAREDYLSERRTEKLSNNYIRMAHDVLKEFVEYQEENDVRYLDELGFEALKGWRKARTAKPSKKIPGESRKLSAVMQDIKHVKVFLRWVSDEVEHSPITEDLIRKTLSKSERDKQRLKREKPPIIRMSVREIEIELRAALAYDLEGERERWACPDVSLLLLTALRRFELVQCTVGDVYLDKESDGDKTQTTTGVELRAINAKNRIGRPIPFDGFTRIGTELLREIVRGRKNHEWITEYNYNDLDDAMRGIPHYRKYKDNETASTVPFSSHVYRRTCSTFELGLPHDIKTKMRRQGHTLAQAGDAYLDPPEGMIHADSLEEIMQCEDALSEILEALKARNAKGIKPRTEHRRRPERALEPRVLVAKEKAKAKKKEAAKLKDDFGLLGVRVKRSAPPSIEAVPAE